MKDREPSSSPLELARKEIDRIDYAILVLIAERRQTIMERVIPEKQRLALPVADIDRMVSHRKNLVMKGEELGIPKATVRTIFDPIVGDSLAIQTIKTDIFPEVDPIKKV